MTGYRYKSVKNLNKSVKVRGYKVVSYRKPRRLTDEQSKAARERVKALKHKL